MTCQHGKVVQLTNGLELFGSRRPQPVLWVLVVAGQRQTMTRMMTTKLAQSLLSMNHPDAVETDSDMRGRLKITFNVKELKLKY
jgi:hypothetical protein